MEYIEFKEVISQILAEQKISQAEFAKNIGTSQGTVSKWLSGAQEPRYCQLQRIASFYDIPSDFLLGLKEY